MPAEPTVRNDPTLLQLVAGNAPDVATLWELVENSVLPRECAMLSVAKGASVVDDGWVRSLLTLTKWLPVWQENPAFRPYDQLCLNWWTRSLVTDPSGDRARIAGRGIRWLVEHNLVVANAPEFRILEDYVLDGAKANPREPRKEAAQTIATAAEHGLWHIEPLADWWAHTEQDAWDGPTGLTLLAEAPLAHIRVFARRLAPSYSSSAFEVLVQRPEVRHDPQLRANLVNSLAKPLGTPRFLSSALWRLAADAEDDFERCVQQYLANPAQGHPYIAKMLEVNGPAVAARLGAARLKELADTSPNTECRLLATTLLAVRDLTPLAKPEKLSLLR